MSSFAARLEIGGRQYTLYRYELTMHQETDALGRPASPVMGGTLSCTLSSPGNLDPFLYQWMLSPTAQYDGLVRLLNPLVGSTLKTVSFFNAYCTSMDMSFQPGQQGGLGSSVVHLQISPQRISVGAIVHDNNWPVESHGAGQSHTKEESGSLSKKVHNVLDGIGGPSPFGIMADINDAALYAAEGNWKKASENLHEAVDSIGNIPGLVGVVASVVDGLLYTAEGNRAEAEKAFASIALGAIPGGKILKRTPWGKRLLENMWGLAFLKKNLPPKALEWAADLAKGEVIDKVVDVIVDNEKAIVDNVSNAVDQLQRTPAAQRLVKNIKALKTLRTRLADRAVALVDRGIDKAIKRIKRTSLAQRLTKNLLALRALKARTEKRAGKLLEKGIRKVAKLARWTPWGRRLLKNAAAVQALRKRIENKAKKVLGRAVASVKKRILRTPMGKRLAKNIAALKTLRTRIRERVREAVDKGIDRVVEAVRRTPLAQRLTKNVLALKALKKRVQERVARLSGEFQQGVHRISERMQRLIDKKLIRELEKNGIKISRDKIAKIARTAEGKIVFMGEKILKGGLDQIRRHAGDFAALGVAYDEIADVVMKAVTNGRRVSIQGARPVYELVHKGGKLYVAATTTPQGLIAGANPLVLS